MSKCVKIESCFACECYRQYGNETCSMTNKFISDPNKIPADCPLPDNREIVKLNAEAIELLKEAVQVLKAYHRIIGPAKELIKKAGEE